ncbi:two component transcriptional regulator, LytTR family [Reichenbachiella faecimaris]|uniref:Two component transcriptional regulator, LytTR family n=1 Tax=Reichenbachiella faecimaris TaxID=692418 RepID=A0A1W2GH19_REIFA|nr:LytTR family DNA-binding domain-containing protein [Reichenbachiella faecimaris]SMD35871.1 two component transcriptional regulator, LytTR family [Reichenbachiella faecimaris]
MTEVVIVEDERLAAEKLSRQLKNIDSQIEIVACLDSVSRAVKFLSSRSVDLIFLDVHLGDDVSFSIFEKIKIKTPIIFTTAYDQYAIKAFKLNSIDYLLKPVSKTDLKAALTKYFDGKQDQTSVDYEVLLRSLQSNDASVYQTRFMVYKGDKVKTIDVTDVAYFFAEGKYVYLVEKSGFEYLVDYTLDKLKEYLNPQRFFRINRQFIIQICAIEEMVNYSKGRLQISLNPPTKKDAIVSIERATAFKNWLNK